MSEKRFTMYGSTIKDNGEEITAWDCCSLLNEQHETIIKQKKVIEEDGKLIQSIYDELTKLRCIKKNLGRIKTQWDWIMEAIQYD